MVAARLVRDIENVTCDKRTTDELDTVTVSEAGENVRERWVDVSVVGL